MTSRVLLVGDEAEIRRSLAEQMLDDRELVFASDGDAAVNQAALHQFDLIALDFQKPSASRLDTFRKFQCRGLAAPILLWTTSQQLNSTLGQRPMERAEMRLEPVPVYEFSNVRVDCKSGRVTRGGLPIFTSAREMQLLKYFIRRRGQSLSRQELLTDVWGFDPRTRTRTIDVHLAWIRQKLESKPRRPEFFLTVRGFGYRFAG